MFKLLLGGMGGILKYVLDPMTSWIIGLLYGWLIRGPLTFLNALDITFSRISGAKVEKLLFDTSLVDGKPQFNFFSSNSPLLHPFIIMVGVGVSIVLLTSAIALMSAALKGGRKTAQKLVRMGTVTSIAWFIPIGFVSVLSIFGAMMSMLSGRNITISKNDIRGFQQYTQVKLDKIKKIKNNLSGKLDSGKEINLFEKIEYLDLANNKIEPDEVKSLDDIYASIIKIKKNKGNKEIEILVQNSSSIFHELRKRINNSNFRSKSNKIEKIIKELTPKLKSEKYAEEIKNYSNELLNINSLIHKWIGSVDNLLTFMGPLPYHQLTYAKNDWKNRSLSNLKIAKYYICGDTNKNVDLYIINNLSKLSYLIGTLVNGDVGIDSPISLLDLRQRLSDIKENQLVVTFYRLATGRNDSNWDRSIVKIKNGASTVFIASMIIIVAIIIMMMTIIFACVRIIDIGILFLISPIVVAISVIDDGIRFKTWLNLTIARIISIFGIILCLKIFGLLFDSFQKIMFYRNSSGEETVSDIYINRVLLIAFGIGGMFAAYKGSSLISGIMGSGYGIMDATSGSLFAKSLTKGAGGVVKKISKNVIIGSASTNIKPKILNPSFGHNKSLKRLTKPKISISSAIEKTWKNNVDVVKSSSTSMSDNTKIAIGAAVYGASILTAGKIGSVVSKRKLSIVKKGQNKINFKNMNISKKINQVEIKPHSKQKAEVKSKKEEF